MDSIWLNRNDGKGRLRALVWTAVMAAAVSMGSYAAEDVDFTVSSNGIGNTSSTGETMTDAVNAINAAVETGRTGGVSAYSADVTLDIKEDAVGSWVLHGSNNSGSYASAQGFNSVRIDGTGSVLNGNSAGMVLKVLHAADLIDVRNLTVTKGSYTNNAMGGLSEVGGAGMTLGGNGTTATHLGPNTVYLENITADGNSIVLSSASGVNAFGAGILVNGHGIDGSGVSGNRSDVTFSGVNLTSNSIDFTKTNNDGASIRGGGARISHARKFTYTNGLVSNNSVKLTRGDHAAGGGISVDGGDAWEDVRISGVQFLSNSVTVVNSTSGGGAAGRGGAFYFLGTKSGAPTVIDFTNVLFSDNSVSSYATGANTGTFYGFGGAVHIMIDNAAVSFSNAVFTDNRVEAGNEAWGGAVMAEIYTVYEGGSLTADNSSFNNNTVEGGTVARGGAVAARDNTGNHTLTNSSMTFNAAEATGTSGAAAGGALWLGTGNHTLSGMTFADNKAAATGSSATASGGAVWLGAGAHTISSSQFSRNIATVQGSSWAMGGALYIDNMGTLSMLNSTTTLDNVSFTGNTARSDNYSLGGAIFMNGGILKITDSSLTGNLAYSTAHTNAKGGAIYVSTSVSSTVAAAVELSATSGNETVISGNRAGNVASGIHFGTDLGNSLRNAELNITGAGTVTLDDPVTVSMNNGRHFTMTKSGTGTFSWDGLNTFTNLGGGSSSINLNEGRIVLGDTFTARGVNPVNTDSQFLVSIKRDATIEFSISRDQNIAMFDFSNTGTKKFEVENGATLTTNLGREIISQTWKFAIASGASVLELETAKDNFNFVQQGNLTNLLGMEVDGSTLYATVRFNSPFDRSGVNPRSALSALDHLLKENGGSLVSDGEYAELIRNPHSATPELYMDQAHIMQSTVETVARTAVQYGARAPYRQRMRMESGYPSVGGSQTQYREYYDEYDEYNDGYYDAYPSLAYCNNDSGARVWGGYVGHLQRRDTGGGYQGYKVETHGFVVGVNYDFSANGTIGLYGGYTKGESKARVSSSKVESDVGHFGLIGRMSPLTAAPEFSVYMDGGYHFAYNDFHREAGGYRSEASFDQEMWTGAVGLEYDWNTENFTLTPHFEARYINLEHHTLREAGNSALLTNVDSINKGSFSTRLGVEFSKDFQLACGIITPALNVSWKHEYGRTGYRSNAFYTRDSSPIGFAMTSSEIQRDSADLGASIRSLYMTGGQTKIGLNASYNLNVSKRSNVHSIYVGFDLGF